MTNEEMQKTMQFILEQQAQFAVDIQKVHETQAQTEQLLNRLAAVTVRGFEDTNAKINALVESQMRLSEAQAKTDENLQNLMAVVDRYFSEGRNGK